MSSEFPKNCVAIQSFTQFTNKMKSQKNVFIPLLFILIIFKAVTAVNEEVVKIASEAEKNIGIIERQLIQAQAGCKDEIKQAIKSTNSSKNLIKAKKNLGSILTPLNNILTILSRFVKSKDYSLSNFQKINSTSCRKIYAMISKLESDIDVYLKVLKTSEAGTQSLIIQCNNLKVEYFSSFILFNKSQSENILNIIALQEKLIDKIQSYDAFVLSSSYQIATILYDIKVPRYKFCDVRNKTTERSSTTSVKSNPKLTTTTTTMSTTKKVSAKILDEEDQD